MRTCDVQGEANNGQEALELLGSINPDVILMDLNMPVMGGLEAIQALERGILKM
ncbi:response regulator [Paenibacillus sp. JZ16]|uniref:response regulator n=1 Tax=Paenibacillus sp. JZ16 TaxID=1906272 RepID=UPI001889D6FF|nr:response regulator [Paenibacillus sp. JZ16]